jgi:hypothetical protein
MLRFFYLINIKLNFLIEICHSMLEGFLISAQPHKSNLQTMFDDDHVLAPMKPIPAVFGCCFFQKKSNDLKSSWLVYSSKLKINDLKHRSIQNVKSFCFKLENK